jgi:hypothetical protein
MTQCNHTHVEITEDEFDERFLLVSNHLNPNAGWSCSDSGAGCLFETFGSELAFVRQQDPRTIWTLIDGEDGDLYLVSGYHFVNRIGYLVSSTMVPDGVFIEVHIPMESDETEPEDHDDIAVCESEPGQ